MTITLPKTPADFTAWSQVQPFFDALTAQPLTAATCDAWLADWTRVANLIIEGFTRANIATSVNTEDEGARKRLFFFLEEVLPAAQAADQKLKEKLLASGLEPKGYDVPLRNLRAEAKLFRAANLPLQTEEGKLGNQYDEIKGRQTVNWEGRDLPLAQLNPMLQSADRAVRERAWRAVMARHLQDRDAFNALWGRFLDLRVTMAQNAGFARYTDYRFEQLKRFDYTPQDCATFWHAIETEVVPAVTRLNAEKRRLFGVDRLKPWDGNQHTHVDAQGRPPLTPFKDAAELEAGAGRIFNAVDPVLGGYYKIMRDENLLDLASRKAKAPGGYCATLPIAQRPFIFMNAAGVQDDVDTLLHEGGHAFHAFEAARLPSHHFQDYPMEFAEVASMAMELLASPYLARDKGGFLSQAEAARARGQHIEGMLRFWPYMAVVDAFQHWVYDNPVAAHDPAACDAAWLKLYRRFHPDVDIHGVESETANGWQQKLHIFQAPFYYVEYGLAQMGAVQVWRNAQRDQAGAVRAYRRALALGGSATLPTLFETAGGRFGFDAALMRELVAAMEQAMHDLRAAGA